jgi:large subunit ribosomal protein L13
MKTYSPKLKEITRQTHEIDAAGQVLGRLSTKIVGLLMGKGKVDYAPHMDMGDSVIVINAKLIKLTGKKATDKVYYSHSGYPGGFKETKITKLFAEHPERIIETAVRRMLPNNRLKDVRMSRLTVKA